MSPPTAGDKLDSQRLYRHLYQLAGGLLYPSETDAPVDVFLWDVSERGALSLDALVEYFGISRDMSVAEVPPEEFFEGITEVHDWHDESERRASENFRRMREIFFANVTQPKHYWVGERTVHVFLWGRTSDGNYVGIRTLIVET
ncbi:MAG: nuclease A inhibitor family protein [Chlorobi bacterium]|jgi:hypothetical protein|nr:nuclease A inhibitor family protein [Chlorobiota bacterium]